MAMGDEALISEVSSTPFYLVQKLAGTLGESSIVCATYIHQGLSKTS